MCVCLCVFVSGRWDLLPEVQGENNVRAKHPGKPILLLLWPEYRHHRSLHTPIPQQPLAQNKHFSFPSPVMENPSVAKAKEHFVWKIWMSDIVFSFLWFLICWRNEANAWCVSCRVCELYANWSSDELSVFLNLWKYIYFRLVACNYS